MKDLLELVARIRTPLTLAGLIVAVLYGIYRLVLGLNIFTVLGESNSFNIISSVVGKIFLLAILAIIIGGASYVYGQYLSKPSNKDKQQKGPQFEVVDVFVETPEHRKIDGSE